MAKDQEKACGAHEARLNNLERSDKEQWDAINQLRNRLPNWTVLLIASMSGALGWVLQWGFTMSKIISAGK